MQGKILKKGCDNFIRATGSTMYVKRASVPVSWPRSSCIDGSCSSRVVNGTYLGTSCDGQCPLPPKPKHSLQELLAAYDLFWQNSTWSESTLPSKPVGDPIVSVKAILSKYGSGLLRQ